MPGLMRSGRIDGRSRDVLYRVSEINQMPEPVDPAVRRLMRWVISTTGAEYIFTSGVNIFDVDAACDWVKNVQNTTDLSCVRDALNAVHEVGDRYLDSDEAYRALAASEVIARLKGNWGKRNSNTKAIDKWVTSYPQAVPAELVQSSFRVLDRVREVQSEVMDEWAESGDWDEWLALVSDLQRRVST